jgi:Ca-activated chloride channel homolog
MTSRHTSKSNLAGVGADLCVCPGLGVRSITGADTQVCPYAKRRKWLVQIVLLATLLCAPALTALAKPKGFKAIVKHLESHYGAKRKRIPFLGVANFAVKFVHPAGVKGFKVAIFEDQDFSPRPQATPFATVMREAYTQGWQPLLQMRSLRAGGNLGTYIYAKPADKDVQFAVTIFEPRRAYVVEVKLNPEAAAKYLGNPNLLGGSLLSGFRDDARLAASHELQRKGQVKDLEELAELSRKAGQNPDNNLALAPAQRPVLKVDDGKQQATTPSADNLERSANANEVKSGLSSKDAIRIETPLVNLNVKAIDRQGQPLTKLTQSDFVVYEDGVQQEITHFTPVHAPMHLVLLLDLSGSTKDNRKVMAEAAKKFIDALAPDDKIALAAFTHKFYALSDFTTDRVWLKSMADKIGTIGGGTAFYDAMWKTLDLLDRVRESRKAIVVLTDGMESPGAAGTEHSFDQLLARVTEQDAVIYPIHLDRVLPNLDQRLARLRTRIVRPGQPDIGAQVRERVLGRIRNSHETAREQLQALAEQTAGAIFTAKGEGDLEGVYQQVAAELRQLYSLAYSPDLKHNGAFRKITVKVKRDEALAKTRKGYYDK